ncbi:6-hydroxymethylpterin diphosphokinase MptE-like protein [Aliarcobacter cryaerophilus]|uniref:motility associated factor glycosyltransferase family protein n=1 Tax=Aliarcobacter cryaerophilus TaxID=28198 RepID=UPI001654C01F|nr:6-hydroxymethylpterin diphosphokinase MptE-like protein [Aliarcobacter cryaerophilus]QNM88301.1 motility associated factor glycosyltransferase family protein [Aliarcobacter cryaerophilus]
MEEAQLELQNALTTTFLANLAFLSEYDNELYHRVDELSRMIENGTYKERYALEFNMQDGDFDIYDIVNDKYLYNKSPKRFNNDLIRKVDFDEKSSILNVAKHFLYEFQEEVDRKDRFNFEDTELVSAMTFNDTWEYSKITNDFLINRKRRLKDIKKFIFMGTLLGRHIPRVARKIDAKIYLVLERNLEIFRLSLFTVDYTILAENDGVIFSIMDDTNNLEKKIMRFLNIGNLENYILKFSTTNINVGEYIDTILKTLATLDPTTYDYNRRMYVHLNRSTKYVKDGYKILLFNKLKNDFTFFKNIPVLYLAAGPSLDENIDWIKKNQNKFFIVTIGAAYKKLLANNIRIDIITSLDESHFLSTMQFDDESVSKISKDTIILSGNMTNEGVLKKFNQENLFLFELYKSLNKNNISFCGYSIGEITLDILLHFNAKDIYLIGLDLALNQETGESHAKGSDSITSSLKLDEEQSRDTFSQLDSLIQTKGNHSEVVFTTPLFFSSIQSANDKLMKKEEDVNVYNMSLHGAYLENTIPIKQNDINTENLKDIDFESKTFLSNITKYSIKDLTEESKKEIENEMIFLENEVLKKVKEISKKDYKNFTLLFQDIIVINFIINDSAYKSFFQIIINKFQIVIPYLFYHFNDIKVKNEEKKVKKIRDVFVKQITNLVNDYIVCLKRVL